MEGDDTLSLYDASHFIPFQRCTVLSTLALQPDARLRFVGLQRIALYSPYGVMRHQLQPFQPPGLLAPERHLSCFDSQSTRRHRDQYRPQPLRSEEHTSELQSLMRISYAVFCLKKKKNKKRHNISKQLHNT